MWTGLSKAQVDHLIAFHKQHDCKHPHEELVDEWDEPLYDDHPNGEQIHVGKFECIDCGKMTVTVIS